MTIKELIALLKEFDESDTVHLHVITDGSSEGDVTEEKIETMAHDKVVELLSYQ